MQNPQLTDPSPGRAWLSHLSALTGTSQRFIMLLTLIAKTGSQLHHSPAGSPSSGPPLSPQENENYNNPCLARLLTATGEADDRVCEKKSSLQA